MNTMSRLAALHGVTIFFLMGLAPAAAQWSAEPGDKTRNAFGPVRGDSATQCRGACGAGCPSSCESTVLWECAAGTHLRRVESSICGTHQGCREHDDCLDQCSQQRGQGFDCQAQCHSEAVQRFGFERATSWATGGGPYDGASITFEYTRDRPGAPEPAYRCPAGARLECGGEIGSCIGAGGAEVDPVFDSYPGAGSGAMRISNLRAGKLCGETVCEQTNSIRVTGNDQCERGSCTRFGLEFEYENADPSAPLECAGNSSGGDDGPLGGLLAQGLDSLPTPDGNSNQKNNGMAQLLGAFGQVLKAAQNGDAISIAPLGPDGKPVESERTHLQSGPAPVPRTVDLASASGHLVIPMYELAGGSGNTKVQMIRCSHQGMPVLETTFRLHK